MQMLIVSKLPTSKHLHIKKTAIHRVFSSSTPHMFFSHVAFITNLTIASSSMKLIQTLSISKKPSSQHIQLIVKCFCKAQLISQKQTKFIFLHGVKKKFSKSTDKPLKFSKWESGQRMAGV